METPGTLPVVVESGGDQVVGHAGLHALGDFGGRLGLGEHLSERIPYSQRPKEALKALEAGSRRK